MNTYIRLTCGHDRVARQWVGYDGESYCCNVCHVLVVMEEVRPTNEPPCGWRYQGRPLPSCHICGAAPGAQHGRACVVTGTWIPVPEPVP